VTKCGQARPLVLQWPVGVDLPFQLAPSFANPTQVLDYHRFLADSTAAFQHDQVEILRAADRDWFIFHNLGQIRDVNFWGQFTEDLDFLGYDVRTVGLAF
jgi:beta-galactosidase